MSPREPIFIVGVQRSGTTLLSAMLSAHSVLSCGPETHFFERISKTEPLSLCEPQTWPNLASDFLFSITHTNFSTKERTPLIGKYQLTKEEINNYLQNNSPSVKAILSSVTEQYMRRAGKKRWVEKTPDHIMYLDMIRKFFPSSPIIRIIRDPRDVALSLTKVPWGAETFLHALLTWKEIDLASDDFFFKDKGSYTIYFENLLASPKDELINLCNFLNEDFEDQMLNTYYSGKQLNSRNVTWKTKASQPLDLSRINAWKDELSIFQKKVAEALIGDRINAHGYKLVDDFEQVGEFFPGNSLVPKYQLELGDLLGSDIRFWKRNRSEKATVKIFLGDPSADGWINTNRIFGLLASISLAMQIISDKFQKKTIYWVVKENENTWSGYNALLLKKLLYPNKIV